MAPPIKGRGTSNNPGSRFETLTADRFDDGWGSLDALAEEAALQPGPETEIIPDQNRTMLARNQSPDIPFDQSINPYQGCEHGCIYCYARPSHNYRGLSSGLDFERKIFIKQNAAAQLRDELAKPGYRCSVISLGANTDPYQPIERRLRITRAVLETLAECRHPVGIVTKSANIIRDLEILRELAHHGLVHVYLSITSLDPRTARLMEPRASAPTHGCGPLKP